MNNISQILTENEVSASVEKFLGWLKSYPEVSYDRMDFFSSKAGVFTKKLFYKNKLAGAPFATLALLQETFAPSLLKMYSKPHREAIGDAHYASGMLNLYQLTSDKSYLQKAEYYLQVLRETSCKDYSGMCWGYTFGWQTCDGYWPAGIPLITITPYAFWAFKKHFELTQDESSKAACRSIAMFALKDLNKETMPNGTVCSSYSPVDRRPVVNANTYRAAVLLEAYNMFGDEEFKTEANQSIDFVLSYQEPDGKWFYEAIGDRDRFVDNFHTCFKLRNLYRCYRAGKRSDVLQAIKKGYAYYRKYLFREDGTPLHFSEMKYNKLRKYEMYDYAEGIILGCYMDESIDGALEFSKSLAADLIKRFQLKDGHFVTRVTSVGLVNKIPYHRWPQAQLFYALTCLLQKMEKEKN